MQPINGPFSPGRIPSSCPAHQLPTVAEAGLRPWELLAQERGCQDFAGRGGLEGLCPRGVSEGACRMTWGHMKLEGGCVEGLSLLGRAGSVLRVQPGPNPQPLVGVFPGGPEGGTGLRSPASSVLDTGPPRA